jgi:NAD(P)H-hydrate epimerase
VACYQTGIIFHMPQSRISSQQLAGLLAQTAEAHHRAYMSTDGTDPEWAIWYSGYLQTLLGNELGRTITRSEIVYLLVKAQKEHESADTREAWTTYYSRLILTESHHPER